MQVVITLNENISPALYGEIVRSFGSPRDMERALDNAAKHSGAVYLIATDDARLRLAYAGETVIGAVLKSSAEPLDYAILSERFALFLTNRPRYPHP